MEEQEEHGDTSVSLARRTMEEMRCEGMFSSLISARY